MFKSARWRGEKNMIKAVFKLQFHATQLTELGGDTLTISVIPAGVGKPTTRSEKAKVRDGSCYWEKPLYETVKFSQDPKSGRFHEKIYHFVVATGSSKFGDVGEVLIDFASYAQATKISSLSLPLKNANFAAVLHILIEKVHGSFDQREVHGSEKANHHDRSLMALFGDGDIQGRSRKEHGSLHDDINRDHQASSRSDITLSHSDSSSGLDTPRERGHKNTEPTHEHPTTKEQHQRSSQWDWSNGSSPKLSIDDSSTSTLGEISEEGSSDAVIQKLKAEVAVLARQAELSELELQTLRKQIVKESKKGQDLLREVATLKEERDAFKECWKKLAGYQNCTEEDEVRINGMLLIDEGDPWVLLHELRQELNHEKDLRSSLQLQLQKTLQFNDELVLASKSICYNAQQSHEVGSKPETDDEEQRALEEIVRDHSDAKEACLLEQRIVDLCGEIELYKRDKDELEMQMEQMALDYEILKQENDDMSYKLERCQLQEQLKIQYECTPYATVNELETQIERLENELKKKSEEASQSILAIKELETHVKNLEEELENQAHGFQVNLEDLTSAKIEQEQRAVRAEDNLRKMRLQNASAATRLQEELRRLSTKMASTFEASEKAAIKAMDEANQLRAEKRLLEDMLTKLKEDLQYLSKGYLEKLVELTDQMTLKSKQLEKMKKQIESMTIELQHERSTSRTEIEKLKAGLQDLEGERLNEISFNISENLFLEKEKDLQQEIEEFERKLEVLVQKN